MQNRSIGPFELEDQLGAGGMGVVYRARYTKTGQRVALKVLSPGLQEDEKLIARFTRELEILKKLKHPNIVQCYGGGRLGSQRFYAMELVEGGSLSELLRKKGRFDWQQVIEYGIQICNALEHAHENGVVHRDLKPANLMLDKSGRIKLADFGLARISDATALTAAGKTLGTFAYMAPEQISGSSPITAKTDLYAFGVVLYELVTGKTPFQTETTAELLMQHLTKKPPRVCTEVLDCPIWLEKVILNLMEKEPDKRPRDALAVEQALREVNEKVAHNVSVAEHAVTGEPTGIAVSTVGDVDIAKNLLKRRKKKKADGSPIYEQAWFLATCLAVVVGLVVFMMWPRSEARLFALAQPLMKSENVEDRERAKSDYLDELIRRFPEGQHAAEAKKFVEDVDTDRVEKLLMVKIEKGRELKEEVERLFKKAYDYDQFGDRVTALEQYNSLVTVFNGHEKATPIRNLARRRVAILEKSGGQSAAERLQLLTNTLRKADQLELNGQTLEAKNIWRSLISLYGNNQELKGLVDYAEARLSGKTRAQAAELLQGNTPAATIPDPNANPGLQPDPNANQQPPRGTGLPARQLPLFFLRDLRALLFQDFLTEAHKGHEG